MLARIGAGPSLADTIVDPVTLLLGVPRREVFHLAVDSRLTHGGRPVGISPKRTELSYEGLYGIASYIGVAALDQDALETSDWIADVLATENVGGSPRFDDLLERLALEAKRRFGAAMSELTIILPAVESGKPMLGMVSNRQTLDGVGAVQRRFMTSTRPGWGPEVIILGASSAVNRQDRKLLETLAKVRLPVRASDDDRERFEQFVQRTIRDVVHRASAADNTIGPDATAWTLSLSGYGGGGKGPIAPTAGSRLGNILGHAGFLFRKKNRGEITADELNDALQEGLGWEKVRTMPDGTRIFKQGNATLELPPSGG